jgi:hypothetical protein
LWCQLPGWNVSLPTIDTSMMIMSTSSAAMARPGLDFVLLGGAKSRLPLIDRGQRGCFTGCGPWSPSRPLACR